MCADKPRRSLISDCLNSLTELLKLGAVGVFASQIYFAYDIVITMVKAEKVSNTAFNAFLCYLGFLTIISLVYVYVKIKQGNGSEPGRTGSSSSITDSYVVQVDMGKVVANLTIDESKPCTEVDALALLADKGFMRKDGIGPDWFLCEKIGLGFLRKDEIKAARSYA